MHNRLILALSCLIVGLVIFGGLYFATGTTTTTRTHVTHPNEDEPGWDCHAMGNHVCGPLTPPPPGMDCHLEHDPLSPDDQSWYCDKDEPSTTTTTAPPATTTTLTVVPVKPTANVNEGTANIRTRHGAGTGMVLTADGLVLTNSHVVNGATTVQVTIVGHTYNATVIGTDKTHDVALIQAEGAAGLTTTPIGNSDQVRTGDKVTAYGNGGKSTGTVLGFDHEITASDSQGNNTETLTGLIQVQAVVLPGYSGGPLADKAGNVIGMDTAASTHNGYAIPINTVIRSASIIVGHNPTKENP